ncbi:MAG: DUF5119 domain-containing protein, partial [Muribaculaceae bacterium]|nr:DUF5119 domain-containing protein [Muribaculaceae bacterium]
MRGFLLCGISLILVSCHQKDLLYPGSSMIKITVSFDWEQAPEACPDGMTVVFFPVGTGGKVWRYELPGRDGGDVELPAGTYNMLAFNNDLRYVFFDDVENLFSYRAYTREVPLSWPDNVTDAYPEISGFESFHSPDPLFCGTASDIEVSLCSVVYTP